MRWKNPNAKEYRGMIGNIEQNYTVFSMSTFGRLSEAAETFMSKEDNREMFKQQLQMKLQREVARMSLVAFVDDEEPEAR